MNKQREESARVNLIMLFAIERPDPLLVPSGSARDEGTFVVGGGRRQGLGVAMIM